MNTGVRGCDLPGPWPGLGLTWSGSGMVCTNTYTSIQKCSKLAHSAVVRVSFQLASFHFAFLVRWPVVWWVFIFRIFKILVAMMLVASGAQHERASVFCKNSLGWVRPVKWKAGKVESQTSN